MEMALTVPEGPAQDAGGSLCFPPSPAERAPPRGTVGIRDEPARPVWRRWLGTSWHREADGPVPGQGTFGRRPVHVSLTVVFLSLFPCPSLSMSLGKEFEGDPPLWETPLCGRPRCLRGARSTGAGESAFPARGNLLCPRWAAFPTGWDRSPGHPALRVLPE